LASCAVVKTPAGAPSGKLYAPLAAYLSVDQIETMMRGLVAAERIRRRGDRYFSPDTVLTISAPGRWVSF
jgi:hypothetical protein